MKRRSTILAACSLIVVACANAEDDSWNGAAGDKINETTGGSGGSGAQPSLGGAPADGGNHSSDGGSEAGPGPTTVTNGPTTTTTGGGACDVGSCESCQGCAMDGPCAPAIDACFSDTECSALLDCMNLCVDDTCLQGCADSHPAAMPLYNAVGECIFCDACPTTCGSC